MRLLFNATNLRSEGGVVLLYHLLEGFLAFDKSLHIHLYLNPELASRLPGVLQNSEQNAERLQVTLFRPRGALRRFYWEQVRLPQLIRAQNIDTLFSFGNTGPRFPGCKQILYVQQAIPYSDYMPPRHRWKWWFFKALYGWLIGLAQRGSARIIVPTSWLVEPMRRSTGYAKPLETYRVTPPGLPTLEPQALNALYAPHEQALLENLEHWRASDEKILIYPCYLAPYKNIPYLLDAIAILLKQDSPPAFRVLLTFSETSREYFPCRAEILKKLAALNALPNASGRIVLTNTLSRSAMAAVYRLSDILVFPSLVETLGLPLLEAMAHGLPMITLHNNAFHNKPLRENPPRGLARQAAFAKELCGEAALYAHPEQPHTFATHLLTLLNDNARWLALHQNAKAQAERFCWETHIQRILSDEA